MNEPKKSGNPAVVWAVRLVVFGVLIGLLVVAWLEFSAKGQYERSYNAAVEALDERKLRTVSQADEYMEGSPDTSETKAEQRTFNGVKTDYKAKVYTWSGPFRSHKIWVWHDKVGGEVAAVSGKDDGSVKDEEE